MGGVSLCWRDFLSQLEASRSLEGGEGGGGGAVAMMRIPTPPCAWTPTQRAWLGPTEAAALVAEAVDGERRHRRCDGQPAQPVPHNA